MKKLVILLFSSAFATVIVMAQESEKHKMSIGLNGGFGQNANAYRLSADGKGFTYYSINPHYSIGTDIGLFISNKIRPRIELRYVQMQYGMNWSENYSDFDKTITTLYNLDLNFHVDYPVFTIKKLQLFVSPAIIYEFVMRDEFKNTFADGNTNYKYYNIFTDQYRQNIFGANVSLITKYKFSEYIGLTITPGYTYFFEKFVSSNDKPYQRLSINMGLEFTLF